MIKDVKYFMLLLLTMLLASTHISYVLIQQSVRDGDGSLYDTLPRALLGTFLANVVGDVEKESVLGSSEPAATSLMMVVLILVVLVVMLNLFIGECAVHLP